MNKNLIYFSDYQYLPSVDAACPSFDKMSSILFMAVGIGMLVEPPLLSRLKYISNYWMNFYQMLYRHSCSTKDEFCWLWWSPGRPLATRRAEFLITQQIVSISENGWAKISYRYDLTWLDPLTSLTYLWGQHLFINLGQNLICGRPWLCPTSGRGWDLLLLMLQSHG